MKVQNEAQHAVATPPAPAAPRPIAPRPVAPQPQRREFTPQPAIKQDVADDLLRSARALHEALGPMLHTSPHFSVDTDTHRVRIEIVDDSGEIVRQIPSEALERFAKSFDRFLGLLIDANA